MVPHIGFVRTRRSGIHPFASREPSAKSAVVFVASRPRSWNVYLECFLVLGEYLGDSAQARGEIGGSPREIDREPEDPVALRRPDSNAGDRGRIVVETPGYKDRPTMDR